VRRCDPKVVVVGAPLRPESGGGGCAAVAQKWARRCDPKDVRVAGLTYVAAGGVGW
jgi:hypothetical protein